jgi:hypothetical protein
MIPSESSGLSKLSVEEDKALSNCHGGDCDEEILGDHVC